MTLFWRPGFGLCRLSAALMRVRRAGVHVYVDGEVEGPFHRFVVRSAVNARTARPVVVNVAHFLPMDF